jgi:hypothetical protein
MVETTAQIESHIETAREHLGANLDTLEQKIRSAADWRSYFQRNPMAILGAAFAGGALLALTTGGHDGRRRSVVRSQGEGSRPSSLPSLKPETREVAVMLDNIKGALIGMAAMKIKDLVGQTVPGFNEEFRRRYEGDPASGYPAM